MVYWTGHLFNKVLRISRSKGFGVQSPFAFRFVREVLNRRCSLPKLTHEDNHLLKLNGVSKQFLGLTVRLLRFQKPETVWTLGKDAQRFSIVQQTGFLDNFFVLKEVPSDISLDIPMKSYIVKSKENFSTDEVESPFDGSLSKYDFATVPAEQLDEHLTEYLITHSKTSSMLFLTNIHVTKVALKNWQRLVKDDRTVITFDLYNHGIVFFDHTKSKQNFKVNYK